MIAIASLGFVVSFSSALLTKQFLSLATSFLGFALPFLFLYSTGAGEKGGKRMTGWMVLSCQSYQS